MSDELASLDATAQADLVRRGEASPTELVDAAIERIERIDPQLHAVIHPRFDRARTDAAGDLPEGPFRGVPMVLKDLDGYQAGEPYHAGTRHLRDLGYVADHDSWLTERFRDMGVVFVGRTNTPELGLLPSTEPLAQGPTRNPWDTARSPAGSSGGSAAAVASGMVPLGHAGDGGGSIRLPASVCGLVGLKPSRGRCSLGPEAGEAWGGLVARLVVTRSVRDTAAVLEAVRGSAPGDPYVAPPPSRPYTEEVGADPGALRVAWTVRSPDPAAPTFPEVAAVVGSAARLLEDLGHHVEERHPEVWDDEEAMAAFTGHFLNGMATWTAAELAQLGAAAGEAFHADAVEPHTWALAELGAALPSLAYHQAIDGMHAMGRRISALWAGTEPGGGGPVDLLVTPTIPEGPWPLGQLGATSADPTAGLVRAAGIVPFTAPFNVTGQPAVSLPLGSTESGLPVGVQLVAPYGREDLLVAVAAQLEAAAPWAHRRPAVHA